MHILYHANEIHSTVENVSSLYLMKGCVILTRDGYKAISITQPYTRLSKKWTFFTVHSLQRIYETTYRLVNATKGYKHSEWSALNHLENDSYSFFWSWICKKWKFILLQFFSYPVFASWQITAFNLLSLKSIFECNFIKKKLILTLNQNTSKSFQRLPKCTLVQSVNLNEFEYFWISNFFRLSCLLMQNMTRNNTFLHEILSPFSVKHIVKSYTM